MDNKEIKDSIREFVDSRIKSPYFGSVLLVWIITNRVVLFGMLNFDDKFSFAERIAWARAEFANFKLLGFIGLNGFTATVVWSLIVGVFAMILYNIVNAGAKYLYVKVNNKTTEMLQRVEPSKWIDRFTFQKTKIRLDQVEEELTRKRSDVTGMQDAQARLEKELELEQQKSKTLSNENLALENKIANYDEQIRIQTEDRNKFHVKYARYGAYDNYSEVTRIVSNLLTSDGYLVASNDTFKIDPYRFKIKDLHITYEFQGEEKNFQATEDSRVIWTDNTMKAEETEASKAKQFWLMNQEELANRFTGEWQVNYEKGDKKGEEIIQISKEGDYYINSEKVFDLQVLELDEVHIKIRKIKSDGHIHADENIRMINPHLYDGDATNGYHVKYRKIDSK